MVTILAVGSEFGNYSKLLSSSYFIHMPVVIFCKRYKIVILIYAYRLLTG